MMSDTNIQALRQPLFIRQPLLGQDMVFETTWGIFSPRHIDDGTLLLLKHLDVPANASILDLGCGYGAIGLSIAKAHPDCQVHLVDKDFVAVDMVQRNIRHNGLSNAQTYLSNGLAQVPADARFDLVISNIPAKVGNEMLTLFLVDAKAHLNEKGAFYAVTINGLRQYMKRTLSEHFDHFKKVKQGKDYTLSLGLLS